MSFVKYTWSAMKDKTCAFLVPCASQHQAFSQVHSTRRLRLCEGAEWCRQRWLVYIVIFVT